MALLPGLIRHAASAEDARIQKAFLFETAPFPRCHASTIVERDDGTLVAAWFGGKEEGSPDVAIWISRRPAGARTWTPPRCVATGVQYRLPGGKVTRYPCWNPVLVLWDGGQLALFYKVGPSPRRWWGMWCRSEDGGRTWSRPVRLPEGILGPIKNKPIRVPGTRRWLAGSSTEHNGWRVHFEWTEDGGATWWRTPSLGDGRTIAAIQPTFLIHRRGGALRIQALGRSRQGRVWTCWSDDGGAHWSELQLTSIPNPNSGIDAVTCPDGRHVLVYNPTRRGRTPLVVATSREGANWRRVAVLEDGPGEFSYPAVIASKNGGVHITYTWRRKRIRYAYLPPAVLDEPGNRSSGRDAAP